MESSPAAGAQRTMMYMGPGLGTTRHGDLIRGKVSERHAETIFDHNEVSAGFKYRTPCYTYTIARAGTWEGRCQRL